MAIAYISIPITVYLRLEKTVSDDCTDEQVLNMITNEELSKAEIDEPTWDNVKEAAKNIDIDDKESYYIEYEE